MRTIEHDDVTVIDDTTSWEESDQSKAFNDFRDKFKDEEMGTLRVHRVPVTNRTTNAAKVKTVYLFSCPIDAFTFEELLEHIRDSYGGGTFRIIGTRAGHRGHAFNRIVEIETPRQGSGIPGVDSLSGIPPGGNPAELINQFGAVILEYQSRMDDMLRNVTQPGGDPLEQMTKMMTAFGTMAGAMGLKQDAPKSLVDQLTEFAQVKELLGGSDGGGDSNIYSLLESTLANLGPALGMAIAQQREAGAIPATGPVQPKLPKPIQEADSMALNLTTMRPQIEFLVSQAKADANPVDVAQALFPGVPDSAIDTLEEFLLNEDYIAVCAKVTPDVLQHIGWINAWRNEMLRLIDQEFDDGTDADADTIAAAADAAADADVAASLASAGAEDEPGAPLEDESGAVLDDVLSRRPGDPPEGPGKAQAE